MIKHDLGITSFTLRAKAYPSTTVAQNSKPPNSYILSKTRIATCCLPFSNRTILYYMIFYMIFDSNFGGSGFVCLYLLKYFSHDTSKNIFHSN